MTLGRNQDEIQQKPGFCLAAKTAEAGRGSCSSKHGGQKARRPGKKDPETPQRRLLRVRKLRQVAKLYAQGVHME